MKQSIPGALAGVETAFLVDVLAREEGAGNTAEIGPREIPERLQNTKANNTRVSKTSTYLKTKTVDVQYTWY